MSEEINLGITPDKSMKDCAPCSPSDSDRPQYPEIRYRGKHADKIREIVGNLAPGDEVTMTSRLKVKSSSIGESDYNNEVVMCQEAIIGDVVEEEGKEAKAEKPKAKPQRKVTPSKTEY